MEGALQIVGLDYACRVCDTSHTVYVSPRPAPDDAPEGVEQIVDIDGHHRLVETDCEECGMERVHVAERALSRYEEGNDD